MRQLRWPLAVVLAVCLAAPLAWAQTAGKISGTVVDAASGEPVPSANVQVVGTTLGATTTIEGEFFILNVPVGRHDLRITSLGYEAQTLTGIDVRADETYEISVRLNETVLEGQEVIIVAERDVVRRDVSATVRSVTSEEITELPVTTYQDALARTPGAVGTGTNIHIRGGRRDEILYLVDGMEVKDPQFALRSLDVPQGAIGEMQVLTAGFSAEYGEAQSAVVNLVIKDGDPEYHGRIEHTMDFEGDNYQNYDYTEATISGPEPITQKIFPRLGVKIPGTMSFFGSGNVWGRNTNLRGTYIDTDPWFRHQVTDAFGLDIRKNQAYSNGTLKLTYTPQPKFKMSVGYNLAQAWENPYWYRMSRRFPDDFTPEQRALGMQALSSLQGLPTDAPSFDHAFGVDDDGDGRMDEEALNWADDDGDGMVDEDLQYYSFNANNSLRTDITRDQNIYFTFNHNVSQKTYYTIRLNMFDANRNLAGGNRSASEYGKASEPYTDMPNEVGQRNGRYDMGEPFTDQDGDGMWDYNNPNNTYPNVNGFFIAGYGLAGNYQQLVPDWARFDSRTYGLRADLASQVNLRHLIKTGLEYNYYDVASEDRPYPSIANGGLGIYTDVYQYFPSSAALYLQDKMEYRDIIINAGLRLDWWKIGGNAIQNPVADVQGIGNYVDYEPPAPNGDFYVSPRLGIAYSVTDRDVFHFNYGYFYQRGRQDYYFTGVNQLQTGGTPIVGNPDLEPMKTIAYELGVRHQFAQDFLLDVSTYYKDIKNWIQTASQNQLYFDLYGYSPVGSNAAIYYNADYASVRGFEFNVSKDYGSHVSGRLTYTLAWATGKNSYDIGSDVTRQNYIEPRRETPLGWDRRHQIVFNLGLNYPLEGQVFSPAWWRSGWSVNLLSQALSGLPYTPTNANGTDVTGAEFSERTPWVYTTDLNLSRAFRMGGLNWRLLGEVRNLFDRENVVGWDVNQYTIDTYIASGGTPGYINDSSSPNYGLNPKAGPNPDAWDIGRLVRAGLAVEF